MYKCTANICSEFFCKYLQALYIPANILLILQARLAVSENLNVAVCSTTSRSISDLANFRNSLLCNNEADLPTYSGTIKLRCPKRSDFVILLYDTYSNSLTQTVEQLNYCNSYVTTVNVLQPTLKKLYQCSAGYTAFVFTLFEMELSVDDESLLLNECKNTAFARNETNNTLLEIVSESCPNSIWITGANQCDVRKSISIATKIANLHTNNGITKDLDIGKAIIKNKLLRIGIVLKFPFVVKEERNNETYYVGILIDLIEKIAQNLDFSYTFHLTPDGLYGGETNDGNWTGLVNQLIINETDIAVADFTVTFKRSQFIDFSSQYQSESVGIMIRLDKDLPVARMFDIFSGNVWLAILISIVISILHIYLLNNFSAIPNNSPFNKFGECAWFVLAGYTMQGSHYEPATYSLQNFMAHWWLYMAAIISVYSGSLMAALSSNVVHLPIKDLHHLSTFVEQGKFKICIHKDTAFHEAIQLGYGYYKPLNDFLTNNPEYAANETTCTQMLLTKHDVAYLTEMTKLEMIQRENCHNYTLVILKENLFPGFYAFGLQKNSPFTAIISKQITANVENGITSSWNSKFYTADMLSCDIIEPNQLVKSSSNILLLEEYTGPFFFYTVGTAFGIVLFLIELRVRKHDILDHFHHR